MGSMVHLQLKKIEVLSDSSDGKGKREKLIFLKFNLIIKLLFRPVKRRVILICF